MSRSGVDVEVERRLEAGATSALFRLNEGAAYLDETFIGPDGVLVRPGRSCAPNELAQEPGSRTTVGVWSK